MLWMSVIRINLFISLLIAFNTNAQINQSFLKHLSDSKLKKEQLYYINNGIENLDSLNYLNSKFHLQYGNDSVFFDYFLNSKNISFKDSLLINAASIYYFKKSNSFCDQWLNIIDTATQIKNQIKTLSNDIKNIHLKKLEYGNDIMKQDFEDYKKLSVKKPWKSALYSALIPGLGKAYIKRYRSFAVTLFSHAIYGLQLFESSKKFGVKHPLTILNMALFGVFYSANIYGSYTETKKIKKEKLHQLLYDASDYFYIVYGNKLYQ
jgi:hypothetical protein